jgi:hypothetical protein
LIYPKAERALVVPTLGMRKLAQLKFLKAKKKPLVGINQQEARDFNVDYFFSITGSSRLSEKS